MKTKEDLIPEVLARWIVSESRKFGIDGSLKHAGLTLLYVGNQLARLRKMSDGELAKKLAVLEESMKDSPEMLDASFPQAWSKALTIEQMLELIGIDCDKLPDGLIRVERFYVDGAEYTVKVERTKRVSTD